MEHQPCHGNRDMYAETAKPSSSLSASKVLGDDDLVGEILGRVDSPATLGRAALASKRWLHVASGRAFLRHFCKRHPPRLLGFYVTGDGVPRPEFVPMPDTSTELAAALRRAAGSVFGSFPEFWSVVQDSRNAPWPSSCRRRRPPFPAGPWTPRSSPTTTTTCYRIAVYHADRTVSAEVTVLLRSGGAWTRLCSATAELAAAPVMMPMIRVLLAGGKVYMVTLAGYIICVDLVNMSLFAIDLPYGVAYEFFGNFVLSRSDDDDSVLFYLVHVSRDQKQLGVWVRRTDGDWVRRDTVSLVETRLVQRRGPEPADGDALVFYVAGVGHRRRLPASREQEGGGGVPTDEEPAGQR
ncbi:hypothetical protein QOZ80_2AG0110410 [Eleusine coracana subsp. coracana]|nr:hypothetical protein QOZ80_2AG0110410 [Eleusine coracana subsp. coracana]